MCDISTSVTVKPLLPFSGNSLTLFLKVVCWLLQGVDILITLHLRCSVFKITHVNCAEQKLKLIEHNRS